MSRVKSIGLKSLLFSISGMCIIAVSLIFFAVSFNKPFIGIQLTKSTQGWIVSSVDITGLANSSGIAVGDKPVEINGQSAQIFLEKFDKDNTVWGSLISEVTVINRDGQSISVRIEGNAPPLVARIEWTIWLLVSVVLWMIGYYVFFKKTENSAALLFCLCGLVLGLVLSTNQAAARAFIIASYIEVAASLIGTCLLIHFFLVLPDNESRPQRNRKLVFLYLPVVITLVLFPFLGFRDGQPVMWFRSLRLLEVGLGFAAATGVAIYNYFKAGSIKIKQQMKIVAISCFAALTPLLCLIVLPQAIWGQKQAVIPAGFGILFIAFIPLGMAYAVITQKLMDIDVFIRRSVVYGLITILMTVLSSTAILIIVNYKDIIKVPEMILLALLLGSITSILFGPTKKGIEFLVDKYFYKDRYDYRKTIKDFNVSLNTLKDFSGISRLLVGAMAQTLNLEGSCLFVKTQDGSFELSATQGVFVDNQDILLTLILQRNRNCVFPNLLPDNNKNAAFLIPLIASEKEVGILFLSQKKSRQNFSSNDLFLIDGMTTAAAVSLHTAMLMRDVSIRDTFVSIASHELRSPLTSVLGYAELLIKKDPPEATRKQWLQHIIDSSQKLTDMVDDLLNVTRIQSGQVVMKLEQVNLSEIFEERLAIVQGITNKHQFVVDIESSVPSVLVDHDKFGEIIGNLLNNAIKYSPKGGCITLSARHEPQKQHVVISINDEGIGIGPADKDSLFRTFHRIQRPETKNIRGSGLGLYIVKEWTKAMGGEVWLESELDKGSTFFVSIPVKDQ